MFLKDFGSGTYATYGIFRILEVIITISTQDFNLLLSDKSKNESFQKLQVVQVIIEVRCLNSWPYFLSVDLGFIGSIALRAFYSQNMWARAKF
jgi:hypothetical protein